MCETRPTPGFAYSARRPARRRVTGLSPAPSRGCPTAPVASTARKPHPLACAATAVQVAVHTPLKPRSDAKRLAGPGHAAQPRRPPPWAPRPIRQCRAKDPVKNAVMGHNPLLVRRMNGPAFPCPHRYTVETGGSLDRTVARAPSGPFSTLLTTKAG